ncbi:MAG: DNA polymerase I, partial [Chloroflexota bacterium]
VVELFRELEFNTILKKLPPSATAPPKSGTQMELLHLEEAPVETVAVAQRDYRTVVSPDALDTMIAECRAGFSVDTESTSLDPMRAELVGLSFSPALGKAYYVPVGHRVGNQLPLKQALERVKPLLEDTSIPKIAHNGKYDMALLANYGVNVGNLSFDTMVAAHLLGEKSLGLKALAFGRLGVEMTPIGSLLKQAGKSGTMADVDISAVAEYACADADMTYQLRGLFEEGLKKEGLWRLFAEVEMPLVSVLMSMEHNGIAIDVDILRRMSRELAEQMGKLELEVYNCVGHMFNINSPQQLGAVLFGELMLPGGRKTKSGYSTEASILEYLREAHPVVALILDYRQLAKLKSTYVDALPALVNPKTGRLHTSLSQTGTATGRLSSSEPNLQNIPIRTEVGRKVRLAFVARMAEGDKEVPARLLASDYSQIDLRALAHLSQDPGLLAAFAHDEDIHAATASQVFGVSIDKVTSDMRRVAKTVNFGVIYGMSDYGLSQGIGLSRHEAAEFISAYFEKYRGVKEYLEATKRQARELGYVQTVLGRRRYIPEIHSPNAQIRAAAERMAINMPVQGTSADIVKLAMIDLQREMDHRGLRSKMILQIHDELLFEVPEEELAEMEALARERMPKALELSVPLKVDTKVGRNWGEME